MTRQDAAIWLDTMQQAADSVLGRRVTVRLADCEASGGWAQATFAASGRPLAIEITPAALCLEPRLLAFVFKHELAHCLNGDPHPGPENEAAADRTALDFSLWADAHWLKGWVWLDDRGFPTSDKSLTQIAALCCYRE